MIIISLLLLLALIFFALYSLGFQSPTRSSLWLGLGLFCVTLWFALGGHAWPILQVTTGTIH
jgi:hypothetical protein